MDLIINIAIIVLIIYSWEDIYCFLQNKNMYDDLYFFNNKLKELVKLNLPFDEAMEKIIQEEFSARSFRFSAFKKSIRKVLWHVKRGSSFGDALDNVNGYFCFSRINIYPDNIFQKIYPSYYINMIKIGEKEGNLYETMEMLNDYLKIMRDCSFSLKNSLEYYVILFIYLLGICKFLGTYIMPTFVCLFEGMDIDPGVFPYIIKHGISNVFGLFLFLAVLFVILRKAEFTRFYIDCLYLKLPVIRTIVRNYDYIIFCKVFSSLLKRFMPLERAIELASSTAFSPVYSRGLKSITGKGQELTVSDTLRKSRLFDESFLFMISLGEKTEKLPEVLDKMADYYRYDYKMAYTYLSRICQVTFSFIAGLTAAIISLGTFMPIYRLISSISEHILY